MTPDTETSFWKARRGIAAIILIGLIMMVAAGMLGLSTVLTLWGRLHRFPPVQNLNSIRISLYRTLCFGTCPAYSVEISGNGAVVYRGFQCVAEKGLRTEHISQEKVLALTNEFKAIDYFSLKDSYHAAITDNPTFVTSIAIGGRKKRIIDYAGVSADMPATVRSLEEKIDEIAGTKRWVFGNGRTCFGNPVGDSQRNQARP